MNKKLLLLALLVLFAFVCISFAQAGRTPTARARSRGRQQRSRRQPRRRQPRRRQPRRRQPKRRQPKRRQPKRRVRKHKSSFGFGRAQPKRQNCDCRAEAGRVCGNGITSKQTRCRNAFIADCNQRCARKAQPQPRRRVRKPRRKVRARPQPRRKVRARPQPRRRQPKRQNCDCRSEAGRVCGNGVTSKQTRCRNAFIADCNQRCARRAQPQPRRRRVRKPRRRVRKPRRKVRARPQPRRQNCDCRSEAGRVCGNGITFKQTRCRNAFIADCNQRCARRAQPQPRRRVRKPRRRVRKPRRKVRARPQPKRRQPKRQNCDCRSEAVRVCGNGITFKQTRCRNAFIADCNQRCARKAQPQPRRVFVRKEKQIDHDFGKAESRADRDIERKLANALKFALNKHQRDKLLFKAEVEEETVDKVVHGAEKIVNSDCGGSHHDSTVNHVSADSGAQNNFGHDDSGAQDNFGHNDFGHNDFDAHH